MSYLAIGSLEVGIDFPVQLMDDIFSSTRDDKSQIMPWKTGKTLINPHDGGSLVLIYRRSNHEEEM